MATLTEAPAVTATLDVIRELFAGVHPRDFEVRLWDGTRWAPTGGGPPRVTLVVERPGGLRRLLRAGSEAALAEIHLSGDVSIEGDIFAVPPLARGLLEHRRTLKERARLAVLLLRLPLYDGSVAGPGAGPGPEATPAATRVPEPSLAGPLHSPERDRAAVTHHYDLSSRFYALFLDPRLVYSCAVFRHPGDTLEEAQVRKLDLVCRKLRLRPGQRLLDIGCGWGALLVHAARTHGVEAVGVTLSERQAEVARGRIRSAGLQGRCRVEVRDYRTLAPEGGFDAVASIGMFEHVGRERAPEYFATIHRLLAPGGVYLHHAITANPLRTGRVSPTLSNRYVFPDHDVIPLGDTLAVAERAGLEVRDVESLREHYALTLRRWVAALERSHDRAAAEVGEPTWRAWRLLFAGAALNFEANAQGVAQALLARPDADGRTGLPLGRWDWFRDGAAPTPGGPGRPPLRPS